MSTLEYYSADPSSENSTYLSGNWYRTLRIFKHPKLSEIMVFRIMMSKLIFMQREEFTETDQVLLFKSWEDSMEKLTDPVFKVKYETDLKICSFVIKNIAALVGNSRELQKVRKYLRTVYQNSPFCMGTIYLSSKLKSSNQVKMVVDSPKKPKPVNRIGRGYRDKGNARNSAIDGSPSWQEVAQVMSQMEGTERSDQSEKLARIFNQFKRYLRNSWESEDCPASQRSVLVKRMRR